MKILKFIFLLGGLFAAALPLHAEKAKTTKRFYGGEILRAEVKPDDASSPIIIDNISPYEPKSRITSDVGYALLTVRMDPGRSLGMYDYSLVTTKNNFPCVALMDTDGSFDGGKWEIKKTKPSRKYTMLFKIQMPPRGKPKFNLRFNLLKNKWNDIPLPFVNVKNKPFTPVKDIPATGMLGEDPYKPKPTEAVPPGGNKAKDKPKEAKKETTKKPVDKEAAKKAKAAEWEAMMGDIKFDKPAEEKKEKKKDEKNKEPAKKSKGKADAWDDWK